MEAIRRFITYRDEWWRLMEAYRSGRFVEGSPGQIKVNPALDRAMAIEGMLVRLATEYGLTPYARMKLGIAVGQATKTLDDLKREAERGDDDDEVDPRIARRTALEQPASNG